LIGHFAEEHIGSHFETAAGELHIPTQTLDVDLSKSKISLLNKLAWRMGRKAFWKQNSFQNRIKGQLNKSSSNILLVTGSSPVLKSTLQNLTSQGIKSVNFLTDDPWSLSHRSSRFLKALPNYDILATPRKSNLEELSLLSKKQVLYLPFGYNPALHFEEASITADEQSRLGCDVLFFGGADADRLPFIKAIIRAGFTIKLYGGYWDRDPETKPYHMGMASQSTIRKAVKASKIVLNLVRRSNRDGHVMRSFEVPAMGGCMLTEETEEHREIFGFETVPFFKTPAEMIDQMKTLTDSPEIRSRFSKLAKKKITEGKNTYEDRLRTVIDAIG
jgi:hypothetical protein